MRVYYSTHVMNSPY